MVKKFIEQSLYENIVKHTVLSCIDCVILFQNKYLVIKRKEEPAKDLYWFSGGRIHKDEKMVDAAIRVCKEEVGLDVIPKRVLGVEETIFQEGKYDSSTHSINVVYLVESLSEKVSLDKNHSDYKWLPISSVPDYLPKYIRDFVEQAFSDF